MEPKHMSRGQDWREGAGIMVRKAEPGRRCGEAWLYRVRGMRLQSLSPLHCGYPPSLHPPLLDCEILQGEECTCSVSAPPAASHIDRHRAGGWLRKLGWRMTYKSVSRWDLPITPFPVNQLGLCYKKRKSKLSLRKLMFNLIFIFGLTCLTGSA